MAFPRNPGRLGYKRLLRSLETLAIKPQKLTVRLELTLRSHDVDAAWQEMEALVGDLSAQRQLDFPIDDN